MITFSCQASCFIHLPSFIETFLHPYILHLRNLARSLARTLPYIFWLLHPSILHLVCLILGFTCTPPFFDPFSHPIFITHSGNLWTVRKQIFRFAQMAICSGEVQPPIIRVLLSRAFDWPTVFLGEC